MFKLADVPPIIKDRTINKNPVIEPEENDEEVFVVEPEEDDGECLNCVIDDMDDSDVVKDEDEFSVRAVSKLTRQWGWIKKQ